MGKTIKRSPKDAKAGVWSIEPGTLSAVQKKDTAADISSMCVLLAEDSEINREMVRLVLERAGASVITAQDGKAAVDIFAASSQGAFHCILMDLMMPVMNGLEATRIIREMDRPDAKAVPIIALSANALEEDVAMTRRAGMDEHLAKPVDMGELFRTMRRFNR